jgi:hypothetical protein
VRNPDPGQSAPTLFRGIFPQLTPR